MPRLLPDNCPTEALSCIVQITRSGQFVGFQSCCKFHQAMRDAGTPDAAVWAAMRSSMSQKEQARQAVARDAGLTKSNGEPSASRVPFVSRGYLMLNKSAPRDFPLPPTPYVCAEADGGYTVVR